MRVVFEKLAMPILALGMFLILMVLHSMLSRELMLLVVGGVLVVIGSLLLYRPVQTFRMRMQRVISQTELE